MTKTPGAYAGYMKGTECLVSYLCGNPGQLPSLDDGGEWILIGVDEDCYRAVRPDGSALDVPVKLMRGFFDELDKAGIEEGAFICVLGTDGDGGQRLRLKRVIRAFDYEGREVKGEAT
jgi:hypothetical protein